MGVRRRGLRVAFLQRARHEVQLVYGVLPILRRLAEDPDGVVHGPTFRVRFQVKTRLLQFVAVPEIIVVQKGHPAAGRGGDAGVARDAAPQVGLLDHRDTRKPPPDGGDGVVGRAAVDDDEFVQIRVLRLNWLVSILSSGCLRAHSQPVISGCQS